MQEDIKMDIQGDPDPSYIPPGGHVHVTYGMAQLSPAGFLGTRDQVQQELDGIMAAVRAFSLKQPDMVIRECAAYLARLAEISTLLQRIETQDRRYASLRTRQIDKWIEVLGIQFKIHSRLVEVSRQELSLHLGKDY